MTRTIALTVRFNCPRHFSYFILLFLRRPCFLPHPQGPSSLYTAHRSKAFADPCHGLCQKFAGSDKSILISFQSKINGVSP